MSVEEKALDLVGQALSLLSEKLNSLGKTKEAATIKEALNSVEYMQLFDQLREQNLLEGVPKEKEIKRYNPKDFEGPHTSLYDTAMKNIKEMETTFDIEILDDIKDDLKRVDSPAKLRTELVQLQDSNDPEDKKKLNFFQNFWKKVKRLKKAQELEKVASIMAKTEHSEAAEAVSKLAARLTASVYEIANEEEEEKEAAFGHSDVPGKDKLLSKGIPTPAGKSSPTNGPTKVDPSHWDDAESLAQIPMHELKTEIEQRAEQVPAKDRGKFVQDLTKKVKQLKNASQLKKIAEMIDNTGNFKQASAVSDLAERLSTYEIAYDIGDGLSCPDANPDPIVPPQVEAPQVFIIPEELLKEIQMIKNTDSINRAYLAAMGLGQEDVASSLNSLRMRAAASGRAQQPYMIKTLEEKFEGIELGDPNKVIADFEEAVKKLEAAFEEALKKVKEYKSADFKNMLDRSIDKMKQNPDKAKDIGDNLAKGIVLYVKSLDNRIKSTFSEYNK